MGSERVLLIEDNPFDARAVAETLAEAGGYTLEVETTLTLGLERAGRDPPEAVLLDLGLPDSAGLLTLEILRGRLRELPVVVMTGLVDERAGVQALRAGAQDYLVKGRDSSLLPRALRYAIERVRWQRALLEAARVAERQERFASLGTLVAGVAHEINNPLTYIRGSSELSTMAIQEILARGRVAREDEEALREVVALQGKLVEGLDRIAALAQTLRRFARHRRPERAPMDLAAAVGDVVDLVRARFKDDLRLEVDVQPMPPVAGYEAEIHQVLLNLLLNAADASPKGVVTVSTGVERGCAVVEVRDDGPGIPPEHAAMIFTPFFTTKPDGTGLGLSLSRRIAEDHGGSLTFVSQPGKGTTFRLELPVLDGEPSR